MSAGDLLGHHAEPRQHLAGQAADAELEALEVVQRLDLLAEPAAHLGAGVAAGDVVDVVVLEELAHQLQAAAFHHPGGLLAAVEAEGQRGVEGEGRVLADVPVRGGVATLDGAVLDRVQHAGGRDDLAGGEQGDLELAAGGRRDAPGDGLGGAEDGIQRFGEARGAAPLDGGQVGREGRGGGGTGGDAGTGLFQEGTPFHDVSFTSGRESGGRSVVAAQAPATVMRSTRIEPQCLEPRTSTSEPISRMPISMSLRLPAMVISCTGYWMTPFSTQKPAAPRE